MPHLYTFWDQEHKTPYARYGRSLLDILTREPPEAIFYDVFAKTTNPRVDKAILISREKDPYVADLYLIVQPGIGHIHPMVAEPRGQHHMVIEGIQPDELADTPYDSGVILPWEDRQGSIALNPMGPEAEQAALNSRAAAYGILLGLMDSIAREDVRRLCDLSMDDFRTKWAIYEQIAQKLGEVVGSPRRGDPDVDKRLGLISAKYRDVNERFDYMADLRSADIPAQSWAFRAAIMWYAYRVQLYFYRRGSVPSLHYYVTKGADKISYKRLMKLAGVSSAAFFAGLEAPDKLTDQAVAGIAYALKIPREYLRCRGKDLYKYAPILT